MTLTSILIIPADPAMLTEGPCGARPPTLAEWECTTGEHTRWGETPEPFGEPLCPCGKSYAWRPTNQRRALVLARGGEVDRHGCLTLADAIDSGPHISVSAYRAVLAAVFEALDGHPGVLNALTAHHFPGATLVLLDADGKETDR